MSFRNRYRRQHLGVTGVLVTLLGVASLIVAVPQTAAAFDAPDGSSARDAVSNRRDRVPSAVQQFTARSRAASRRQGGSDAEAVGVQPVSGTAEQRQSVTATETPVSATDDRAPGARPDKSRAETGAASSVVPAIASAENRNSPTVELGTAPDNEALVVPPLPAESDKATAAAAETPLLSGGMPIDLGSALALVAGQNPEVGFAQARVREAYARLDAAELLWVPDLQAGVSYHRHEGNLQDVGGRIVDINRSSLNAGFGAGATGAGTVPYPGLVIDVDSAEAIFGPEIARRSAWASRHAADAELNDQLLNVALAYLALTEATQQVAIARDTIANADDLARTTADFAQAGQGLQADAERAATERRLRQNDLLRAEEAAAVASARLAQLLRLSAAEQLIPVETVPVPIDLVPTDCEARLLVSDALGRRPELRQQRALVEEARLRLRQEKYAPLLPSVLVGASYGGFGGGLGDHVGSFHDRADLDAVAVWEVRNLGFGERAARSAASARVDQNRFRQLQMIDTVAREVVEAHVQVSSRRRQVAVAEEAIATATSSYRLNRQRIAEGQGLPIETLQAIQSLDATRRDYVRALTDYNEAQFRLHRALGWPIQ